MYYCIIHMVQVKEEDWIVMKMVLETPQIVAEARGEKRGWNWFVEMLVFVAVFFASSFAMLIVMVPGELMLLMGDARYQAAIASGDVNQAMEASTRIAESNAYMILSLFSDIVLILVVWLFCWLIQKRKIGTLGFTKKGLAKEYLIGAAGGFAVFAIAVLLSVVTGSLRFEGVSDTFSLGIFVLFLLGYMIQGMAEEVLCRGYFMISFARRYPMVAAVLVNALIFAALHLGNPGITPLAFLNLTLFGIFASCYFIRRGNIWGIGAFHSIWNLVQGNFYGIKVSGLTSNCTLFSAVPVEGRELINGGNFGMEGGLAVTLVLVIGIALLCFVKGKKTSDVEA